MARPLGKQAADLLLPYVQQRLWSEGGVVLLDGLDEVPAANRRRQTLLQAVAGLLPTLPKATGRIVVTAHPYAYANPQWRLEGFVTLALAPFDEGQRARFIQRWHQAARPAMAGAKTSGPAREGAGPDRGACRAPLSGRSGHPSLAADPDGYRALQPGRPAGAGLTSTNRRSICCWTAGRRNASSGGPTADWW